MQPFVPASRGGTNGCIGGLGGTKAEVTRQGSYEPSGSSSRPCFGVKAVPERTPEGSFWGPVLDSFSVHFRFDFLGCLLEPKVWPKGAPSGDSGVPEWSRFGQFFGAFSVRFSFEVFD